MKKLKKIFCMLLFFLMLNFFVLALLFPGVFNLKNKTNSYNINNNIYKIDEKLCKKNLNHTSININNNLSKNKSLNNKDFKFRKYTFIYGQKVFKFSTDEFLKNLKISKVQNDLFIDEKKYMLIFDLVSNFGLSKREISNYFFPELELVKSSLCEFIDILPEENFVTVNKNNCELDYYFGKNGRFLNQKDFYEKIFDCVKNNSKDIKINIEVDFYKDVNDIKNDFQEKSVFETDFSKSNFSRKNNIKVALEKFDGIVLEKGESLSFNKTTGERNEKSGYMPAKIISNGTFINGYGGGVCQVSTTLYNACLLAGLEIIEVHNHSLPVSYIEPSFDAMVNSGTSDLIFRNNTNGKIIITTSSKNDVCKVKIFGMKNKFKITKTSVKTKIIPAENDVIETDYLKYNEIDLNIGEERRISYPKDGFYSKGYLNFYDENGILIEKRKIRENCYNPTKGVVLRRES